MVSYIGIQYKVSSFDREWNKARDGWLKVCVKIMRMLLLQLKKCELYFSYLKLRDTEATNNTDTS